jgi:NAD(P)-dependent dehydrogenase (short-subunit alcohol dehydrogenase family)
MEQFKDRTAVVTGAASGMGRSMAERFASEGMRVVLADVEEQPLRAFEEHLLERGVQAIAVQADVRKLDAIQELERRAVDAFGNVHILVNDAGVGAGGLTWQTTNDDWEWTLGVNLWGVIHGLRTFLPRMIEHGEEGHVVNTASMAGLVAGPFMAPYNVSKFGVVALSETVYQELLMTGSKIGVSVLCPGFVNTNIGESARNRPPELAETADVPDDPQAREAFRQLLLSGMPPDDVAEKVLDAVRTRRFYILTHPEMKPVIQERMGNILDEKPPPSPGYV